MEFEIRRICYNNYNIIGCPKNIPTYLEGSFRDLKNK